MTLLTKPLFLLQEHIRGSIGKGRIFPILYIHLQWECFCQKEMCTEEVIAAGILHDTVEDTSATYEELEGQFGAHICNLVEQPQGIDKSLPCKERKQHTLIG